MNLHILYSFTYTLKSIQVSKIYKISKIKNKKLTERRQKDNNGNFNIFPELIPANKFIIEKYSYLSEFKYPLGRIKLVYPQIYELLGLKELEERTQWKGICNCIPLLVKYEVDNCKCLGPKVYTMPYNVKQKILFYSQSKIISEVKCTPSYDVFNPRKNSIECINGCAKSLNCVGPSNCIRILNKQYDGMWEGFDKFGSTNNDFLDTEIARMENYSYKTISKLSDKLPQKEYLTDLEKKTFSSFMQYINNFQGEIRLSKKLLNQIDCILIDLQYELETGLLVY